MKCKASNLNYLFDNRQLLQVKISFQMLVRVLQTFLIVTKLDHVGNAFDVVGCLMT